MMVVSLEEKIESVPMSVPLALSERAQMWLGQPSSMSSVAPGPPPSYRGHSVTTTPKLHRHHPNMQPYPVAPSLSKGQACDPICTDPLTATPFGSPCGCVFPMKVRLVLDIAPLPIFPVINELEIEVASGTYLKQSQVRIMGVSADSENQGRTIVDINLVPLGEKFDDITFSVICERFWHKKVPLNKSLFGDFEVLSITYPDMPASAPHGPFVSDGNHPDPRYGAAGLIPFTATVISSKNQKMCPRTIIIIALSSFVLLLVLVGALSIMYKWSRRPSSAIGSAFTSSLNTTPAMESMSSSRITRSRSMSLVSTMATSIPPVKRFSLSEIQKATDKFSSKRVLGEGGFGRVYCGTLGDGTEVAVKLLTMDNQNREREFITEIELLSRLHHRNLVKLIGICMEGRRRCLVYELVRNGSVESHLHGVDKKNSPLGWGARTKIALGAARGLAYLHEDSNPRVIHRDFKASNVLLEDDFTPKVSDFGLAREATEGSNHISTRVMGTFGYVAPEYAMTGHLLVKSDVYSYGVVLLELLTGRKPVDMSQPPGQENLVTYARPLLTTREGLEQLVDPSLAGTYEFDEMAKMASIASMCVHQEVTQRPFMGEVVQALKLIYNDTDESLGSKDSPELSDFLNDISPSENSWWNTEGEIPRSAYGQASPFMTMEYSSGPLEEIGNKLFSASSLISDDISLPIKYANRSGPLKTAGSKVSMYKLTGSWSVHGVLPSKHVWNDG
ncbi:PREDICTED: receptor-like serine/threonine-protein kinase ALE2 isoform X2 [Lupinus angustifolius]|uniref:receptor-like serine/threonine-protein kinase ALE2 isoform X2 n=1 Tax=Lupinus angustifolius TaxID=3871 RepID=UPI00092F60B2|nr:PREDICTED: receptor-like serine/threonine-protein kinase ALE2 isoform X2 [Lupinus angustifolius]